MSAANFQAALDFIWNPQRDGRANDSAPGETWLTSWGCTQYTWNYAVEHGIVKGSLTKATKTQLTSVYLGLYWNVLTCSQLPPGLDVMLFEQGTLAGTGAAAKVLQRIVRTVADGVIGGKTRAAVAKQANLNVLIDLQSAAFIAYLKTLKNWPQFKNGWTTREKEALALAHKLAGAST